MAVYHGMSRIQTFVAALLLTFTAAAHAGQQTRFLLQPTVVQAPPAGPSQVEFPINVTWPVLPGPATIQLTNGSPQVDSAYVFIDDVFVLTLMYQSSSASTTVTLAAGPHTVRVMTSGGSVGSFLTVSVTATVNVPNLATARADHTATLMPDGRVLFAGGGTMTAVWSSTESMASDLSSIAGSTPLMLGRAAHTAATFPGGAMMFAGGREAFMETATVELRLPGGGTVSGPWVGFGRKDYTSTVLPDGRILVLGGQTGPAWQSGLTVDPRPDPFTNDQYDPTRPGIIGALGMVLQTPRSGHTATLLPNGKVLVVGGRTLPNTDVSSVELVDPVALTSVTLPLNLSTPRSQHTATLRSDGSILITGGVQGPITLATTEIIRANLSGVDPGAPLQMPRSHHTATMIRGGEILIAGGWTGTSPIAHTELAPVQPPDTLAPSIITTAPVNGAANVDRGAVITLHISEPIAPATVSTSTLALRNSSGAVVSSAINLIGDSTLIAIRPSALLTPGAYTVTGTGVTDAVGNPLPGFYFNFTSVPSPNITAVVPLAGPKFSEVVLSGTGFSNVLADNRITFGTALVPATSASSTSLSFTVPNFALGSYAISLRTRGGTADAPSSFTIVNPVPSLTSISPSSVNAGSAAFTLTLSGTNFVSGATVSIGTTSLAAAFVSATTLTTEVPATLIATAGSMNVHAVNPSPGGGASNDVTLTVQSTGPTVTAVTIFPRGQNLSVGATQSFSAEARYSDGTTVNVTNTASWQSSATGVLTVNASGQSSAVAPGNATITVTFAGQPATADVTVSTGEAIPPDPADVAPALNPAEAATTADATRFLYEGENPIQRGVTPGAIETRLAAVISGTVSTRDGQPLSGAHVAIKDQSDLGHTLTRADGAFDLAVNGGGSLVVRFSKDGFLPVDRRVVAVAGEFGDVDAVVMIALDPVVTHVDLGAAGGIQVARGSVVTDGSGSRQATVLFPPGTTAAMRLPNGTMQSITDLHVRATEFTVGATGPDAMPGTLPIASAYTHAVELSVDEAIAAGATSVQFSAPLPAYYENFLGFPVGADVPTGYYDRSLGAWVPSDNGVVLKILSVDGSGRAELDLDGDGNADNAAALAGFSITDGERVTLANTYITGQELWRVVYSHFTPFDHNWPKVKAADADNNQNTGADANKASKKGCVTPGSIIECQDQVLGETIPLTGTPYSLNYRSDRAPGFVVGDAFTIRLTDDTVPASLQRVDLTVQIAGQTHKQSFAPAAGLTTDFTWNRLDKYGRPVHGSQTALIKIDHIYPVYYTPRPTATRPFYFGQLAVTEVAPNMFLVPGRSTEAITAGHRVQVGPPPAASPAIAGWSIDPHHVYDVSRRTLYLGSGEKRVTGTEYLSPPVERLNMHEFVYANAVVGKTGIYYAAYDGGHKLFRQYGTAAPEAVATLDRDSSSYSLAVDDAGNVYHAHCTTGVPGGVSISRFVSGSSQLVATATTPGGGTCSNYSLGLARAPDGTLYLSKGYSLFQLSTDGVLEHLKQFPDYAEGIAVGPDGSVYRNLAFAIERVLPSGDVVPVAGTGVEGSAGDGGPAIDAELGYVYDFAVGTDGSLFIADFGDDVIRLRRVGPDGMIRTYAGGAYDTAINLPDGTPASAIGYIQHVAVGPDGWIYAFGHHGYRFAPDFNAGELQRIASADGSEVYEFNAAGRHLRTRNGLTGADTIVFGYDGTGRLTTITDGDGLVTTIQRNPGGSPTAIVAPFGQTTTIVTDNAGWLSRVVAPGNREIVTGATSSGLLTTFRDARNELHTFTYDAIGRLQLDEDPADGSQSLVRVPSAGGWTTTRTSAMGRVTAYRTETLEADGSQQVTITAPDGTISTVTSREDGGTETVSADGTRSATTTTPDPRFGLQVPIASGTVTTPGGLTMSAMRERYAEFVDPQDFSTLTQWDYATINGRVYETIFDGSTRTFTTTSPAGRITTSTIDAQGRVTSTQVGLLTPITFTYDAQGRLTTTTQGPRQSTITYDASGRPSVLTDALTRSVTFGYDTADRVTSQTLPDTRVIGFGYDPNSNVTSLTPPGRPAHSFTYTPIDLTSSYTPPAVAGTGPTGYLFNVDRQPTEVQRPDGQTTTFAYGATNGRLTGVTFSRGTLTYGYDAAGRVNALSDPGGVNLAFTYDGSLPLTETWSGGIEGSVARTFTNNFELATEQVNGAHDVAFAYDDDRFLTGAGALTIARRTADGLVSGTTLGTTVETHDYNEFGEPSRQTSTVNSTQVFDVQMTRDNLGRIGQRIETVDGITRVFQYGYDLAGRLENVTRNGDLVVHYTYDANGNRLSAEGEAGLVTGTYDDQDRLLTYGAASYTYTANGELATKTVGGQATSYTYDTLGNLIQVSKPNGDVITYTIDGRGRRVGKSLNGTRVKGWLYADQLRPIAELDGDGNVVARFVYGTKPNVPDYIIKNGTTYRVFSDHLGSPRVIVDANTGVVVQRMDFHAFGELIQDSNPGWQPFGFTGCLWDGDTTFLRCGARDYDPVIGRWLAKDDSRFRGRDTNLYRYAAADPVNWRDPNGRFLVPGAIMGGIIGAVSGYSSSRLSGGGTFENAVSAVVGGLVGAVGGFIAGPAGGAIGASVLRGAALGAAAGLHGNLIGQIMNRPLSCLEAVPAVVSTIGGALGGAFGAAAIAGAELMGGALGPWATAALESVGATLSMAVDTISNVIDKRNDK